MLVHQSNWNKAFLPFTHTLTSDPTRERMYFWRVFTVVPIELYTSVFAVVAASIIQFNNVPILLHYMFVDRCNLLACRLKVVGKLSFWSIYFIVGIK